MDGRVSELRAGEPRRRPLLPCLRGAAPRRSGGCARGAEDRHGPLLRHRRLDAARRAALNDDLRRAYGVELEMRIGINTGQVVAGRAGAPTLATGDAVNLAKRLEQAAGSGEILIGAETYRLVRDCVEAVPLEARPVKGKA